MDNLFWIGFVGAALALIFAYLQKCKVMKCSEGDEKMVKIASSIRAGANAYLKQQYSTVAKVFAVVFVILLIIAFASKGQMLSRVTPFAFLTGGIWSMLAGLIGMKIATAANARTANAAHESLNHGLNVAFSSGTVMGFTVVGLGILDITLWFIGLRYIGKITDPTVLANIMVMNGMGASFMALFARVGGGIYTKAADVGADLVGKVEAGIPEDDPRNPATIADNVGDNVGDVAGMGADLYESYVGSILATFALSAAANYGWSGMLLPVALAVCGIVCSLIGSFLIKTKEDATQMSLLKSLRTGTYTAAALSAVLALPLSYLILGPEQHCWGVYVAILCGLIGGCAIGYFTEYYTSDNYKPTQQLAAASETGSATIIIGGISLGLKSTMASILIVSVAILLSYFCAGGTTTIIDASGAFTAEFNQGLYGIGIAAVGMLSTLGITLATDAYGPVADNAGGIAEMSGLPEEVRDRTDALDSLGNTTAATGKGFAIGSASLTALALLVSYVNIVQTRTPETLNFTLTSPSVLVGLFIGAMLTFVFSALTMSAVQTAAQSIVVEVRRQFREIVGIMDYKADPDYAACVSLCTKGALHEMVAPALLAVVVPIVTGLILGPTGVVGLLGGVSVTGFAMAVFMSNAGGAWDNAKKYIERGNHGGKGSPQHKAAVVGDTVGDPFKDTSGPSLNILIKLCSTVSIVFAGLIIAFNLMNVL
ncbi:MAG: sodium-translocating pyrophosphatase [Oscillospiraceae bacterium]|jgi:K(+)-stimulated pyrophosphate-energized sodium pump|nr:sodium-translocating pyrophosphatase [Bacillota bacterium]MDY4961677.1 sodium-translocating pyrophosphatase [Oscillospiraceae bacterium]UYI83660.1 MAG: sodium-translocating pyrophosphatase [Clostridiales bacterium]CCX46592.1 putative K(+)-stimulated pyrophosphate-energized sodium pump [Firmicutes bacterium CAG:103]HCG31316.1 sodium-translocating pyrophosphatase [Clostridiales bacterium]